MTASAEDRSAEDQRLTDQPRENQPPGDHRPDERRKMTVSERNMGTLAADLQGWLAGRLGHPEGLTVSGVRVPGSGGLSSTSVLFEAGWTTEGDSRHAPQGR